MQRKPGFVFFLCVVQSGRAGKPTLHSGRVNQSCLLELELIEPSLFFAHAPQAAARFAACISRFARATGLSL